MLSIDENEGIIYGTAKVSEIRKYGLIQASITKKYGRTKQIR